MVKTSSEHRIRSAIFGHALGSKSHTETDTGTVLRPPKRIQSEPVMDKWGGCF